MKLQNSFSPAIAHVDLKAISRSEDSIFVVNSDLQLVGYNQAWVRFACENGLPDIEHRYGYGFYLPDSIPEALQDHYREAWIGALREQRVYESSYECSSPDQYRKFHQTAYPIHGSKGLIITNHCVVETTSGVEGQHFDSQHLSPHGFVVQCCNCRKVQDFSGTQKWDWIPALVDQPYPDTSHSICPHCLDHYYPDIDD